MVKDEVQDWHISAALIECDTLITCLKVTKKEYNEIKYFITI